MTYQESVNHIELAIEPFLIDMIHRAAKERDYITTDWLKDYFSKRGKNLEYEMMIKEWRDEKER